VPTARLGLLQRPGRAVRLVVLVLVGLWTGGALGILAGLLSAPQASTGDLADDVVTSEVRRTGVRGQPA